MSLGRTEEQLSRERGDEVDPRKIGMEDDVLKSMRQDMREILEGGNLMMYRSCHLLLFE